MITISLRSDLYKHTNRNNQKWYKIIQNFWINIFYSPFRKERNMQMYMFYLMLNGPHWLTHMHKARVNKWVVMFIANWPGGQGSIIPPGDCGPPEIVYTWSGNSGQIHRLTWGLWSTGNCYTWSGKCGQIHHLTWGLWFTGNCYT